MVVLVFQHPMVQDIDTTTEPRYELQVVALCSRHNCIIVFAKRPQASILLFARDEQSSKHGGGVGDHKTPIFIDNISIFHMIYRE
jgi:hypothetical protein